MSWISHDATKKTTLFVLSLPRRALVSSGIFHRQTGCVLSYYFYWRQHDFEKVSDRNEGVPCLHESERTHLCFIIASSTPHMVQLLFHLWCCVIWYHNIPFGLALTLVYIGHMPQGGWATKFPYTKAVTSLYEVTRFPSGLGVMLA